MFGGSGPCFLYLNSQKREPSLARSPHGEHRRKPRLTREAGPSPRRRVHTPDVPASSTENQGHEQREEKRHLQLSPADRGAGRGGRRGHAGLGRARRSPATDSDPSWVGGVSGVAGARGVGAPRLPGACVVAQVPTGEGRAVWPSGPSGPCGFAVPLPRTARLRRENPGSPRLR